MHAEDKLQDWDRMSLAYTGIDSRLLHMTYLDRPAGLGMHCEVAL